MSGVSTAIVVANAFGHHEIVYHLLDILKRLPLKVCIYDPNVHIVKAEEEGAAMSLVVVSNNNMIATCPIEVEKMNVCIKQGSSQWKILEFQTPLEVCITILKSKDFWKFD